MSISNLSPARQKFWYISRIPDAELTNTQLVEGALAIAWEEYPRIDLAHYRAQLDHMGRELRDRLGDITYPMRIIKTINQYLFAELGFRGNDADYYNPCNSFLTDVIDRRLGIPITLSVVYMAVGDRINFPLEGVNMPGHFIIRPQHPDVEVFIDPFHKGEVLFEADCASRLAQVYNQSVTLKSEYLKPVPIRRILERMLMNLKLVYLHQRQLHKALAAVERILMLYPNSLNQLRDHGLICYQLHQYVEARADLENYLAESPYADDAKLISKLIEELK